MRLYSRTSNRGSFGQQALEDALKCIKYGESVRSVSRKFGIPPKTLRRHRDQQVKMPGHIHLGRMAVFSSTFENDLVSHIQHMERALFRLTSWDVRKLAYDLATKIGIQHRFNDTIKVAGQDLFQKFMMQNPSLSVRTPQATSLARAIGFNKVKVGEFFDVYENTLRQLKNICPTKLWNMDETGVQNVQKPQPVVATKGARQVGRMTSAERGFNVTVLCAMSAAGQFVPPMFIFPRKRMCEGLMRGAPPGSVGSLSDSGWIDGILFVEWLTHFAKNVNCSKNDPHILILDGHHSHTTLEAITLARDLGIIMISLPPHCSHKMQPVDRTFFRSLKMSYDKVADQWMTKHPGKRIRIYEIAGLFGEAYSQAASVGKGVEGFRACGLMPCNRGIFGEEDFRAAEVTEKPEPAPQSTPSTYNQTAEEPFPETTEPSVSSLILALSPHPKLQHARPRKRKAESAAVRTSSPYKRALEEKVKGDKKMKKPQANKKIEGKKKTQADDAECLYCTELFSVSGGKWIRCEKCMKWAHEECSNATEAGFWCEFCVGI